MSTLTLLASMKALQNISPMKYAFLILTLSIATSLMMFKATTTSWVSLVLIMVFSSGMMTLFIYVSSLAANEKSSSKRFWRWLPLLAISLSPMNFTGNQSKTTMKMFSYQTLLVILTMILIVTMLAISLQSFNPQQTMSSTF